MHRKLVPELHNSLPLQKRLMSDLRVGHVRLFNLQRHHLSLLRPQPLPLRSILPPLQSKIAQLSIMRLSNLFQLLGIVQNRHIRNRMFFVSGQVDGVQSVHSCCRVLGLSPSLHDKWKYMCGKLYDESVLSELLCRQLVVEVLTVRSGV